MTAKNPYFNGMVRYQFTVSIESADHQTCLTVSKKIKDYLSAWAFGCSNPHKSKSARKDDVLSRSFQSSFEGYPATVIAFREGLRCICYHYDLFVEKTTVKITDHGTSPKDSHINIFK
jgi:hypothetical protein